MRQERQDREIFIKPRSNGYSCPPRHDWCRRREVPRAAFAAALPLGEKQNPKEWAANELEQRCRWTALDRCRFQPGDAIRHQLKTNDSNSQVPWQERVIQEEGLILSRKPAS